MGKLERELSEPMECHQEKKLNVLLDLTSMVELLECPEGRLRDGVF